MNIDPVTAYDLQVLFRIGTVTLLLTCLFTEGAFRLTDYLERRRRRDDEDE